METLRRLSLATLLVLVPAGKQGAVRFLRFAEAEPLIAAFASSDSPDLPAETPRDGAAWDRWVRSRDREIRARINRGIEDSISNLILFGTSYCSLPRLEGAEEATGSSGALTELARRRVHALALALSHPGNNERLRFVADFLNNRHIRAGTRLEAVLSSNLRRFASEQRSYQEKLRAAGEPPEESQLWLTRGTLFAGRGLSVDTSLLPNLAVQETLRALIAKGLLPPGQLRRVAVIGPGLDFTDKRDGYDFYPLQTIQPLAVLETVARLSLGRPDQIEVATFDLNPLVNAHLQRLVERARSGHAYTAQLPRDTTADWNRDAIAFWEHFGDTIGSPVAPLRMPEILRGVALRAVAIPARYAGHVQPFDLDIVAETLDLPPGGGFDLVVATNILVYYNRFEQALAMAAIAQMMSPGGVFLCNTALPAQHPATLEYLGRRSVSYSTSGGYGDDIVVYRRR